MECTLTMPDNELAKFDIKTQAEFEKLCKNAVISVLFELQFDPKRAGKGE